MIKYNIDDIIVCHNLSIKDAMKKLDIVASRQLFVVNESGLFVGSLTDGDIRRALLSNNTLKDSIIHACNRKSFTICESFDKDDVVKEMITRDIVFAPILDVDGHIVSIFSLPDSNKIVVKRAVINDNLPVIIMAGGKGTRMAPFTNVLPKPLIPIGDKTILELILDEFSAFGIEEYYLTLNFKGEIIKAYFDTLETNYKIGYIWEKNFFGTAGSLLLAKEYIQSTFIVSNCDIIISADIADVYRFHKDNNSLLTIVSSIQHHKIPYGVVDFSPGGKVTALREKPEYSFPINTGVYILEPECLDYIPDDKVFHMTHLIEKLLIDNKCVCTYPINESEYIDIGQWDEYRRAVERMGV